MEVMGKASPHLPSSSLGMREGCSHSRLCVQSSVSLGPREDRELGQGVLLVTF